MSNIKRSLIITTLTMPLFISSYAVANDNIKYSHYRAANTPVNYSFFNFFAGHKNFEDIDENLVVAGVTAQTLLNESFIFKLGYTADIFNGSGYDNTISYQNNQANIGIGWRHAIFTHTDIELDSHLLYNWKDEILNDNNKKWDAGYRVGGVINHGIGDSFEVKLGINYTAFEEADVTRAELSFTQYITRYVGVGLNGYIAKRDDEIGEYLGDLNYIGLHLKLAFY